MKRYINLNTHSIYTKDETVIMPEEKELFDEEKVMKVIDNFQDEYRFLSNFYQFSFEYKDMVYPNAEAAFQAQKCGTDEERIKYTQTKNPIIAKRMGKREPGFPENWDEICYGIMKEILECKFKDPGLREKLLATGDAQLIEGNHWHDNRWGNCTCEKCKNKTGQNWLGTILMDIRENL